jgi:hypothetical protein
VDDGVYYVAVLDEGSSSTVALVEFVAWPDGSDHTACPAPLAEPGGRVFHAPQIRDAP